MSAPDLRAAFAAPRELTVGLEEEVMLLEPASLELLECAPRVLEQVPGDARFKLEMPASQLELITPPRHDVPAVIADLAAARRTLVHAAADLARPAAAGAHPFSLARGGLNPDPRFTRTAAEYGEIARRQLVCALQVHVAVGGLDRSLVVYNALREQLPALAALAANAPFHEGRDTGLASVRPTIAKLLPRQGVPPAFGSWEELERELGWGASAGVLSDVGSWWWELRPHPAHGTLELRVPDAQTTLSDAAAIAAVAHSLVAWLVERHDGGEPLGAAPTWRIEENRWVACRHGLEGAFADLRTGERRPVRECLNALVDQLEPVAERLGNGAPLAHARRLIERNGAERQRQVAAEDGIGGLAGWLADGFEDGL